MLFRSTPYVFAITAGALELEARGQLHLTLTEECAISAGNTLETARTAVEIQERSRGCQRAGSVDRVDTGVNGRYQRSVEDIEAFNEELDFGFLGDAKSARYSHVRIPNLWLLEEAARDVSKPS